MSDAHALRRAKCPRRGLALIWVVMTMVVFLGFAAFAIDMGRIHLTRTELQTASDGAARAGVWPVPQLDWAECMARSQGIVDANDAGGRAEARQLDVTKDADIERLVDFAATSFGRIEILHNHASIHVEGTLEQVQNDERVIEVYLGR